MGVPYQDTDMTRHPQHVTVRNSRGREMLDLVRHRLAITPTSSTGDRRSIVMEVRLGGAGKGKGGALCHWCLSDR